MFYIQQVCVPNIIIIHAAIYIHTVRLEVKVEIDWRAIIGAIQVVLIILVVSLKDLPPPAI